MSRTPPGPPVALAQRLLPETGPDAPVEIAAPPVPPEHERGWLAMLLPGLSALGMLGFALLSPNVLVVVLCGGFALLSALGAVVAGRLQLRRRQQQWQIRSDRYGEHLDACLTALGEASIRQRTHALAVHPAPMSAARSVGVGAAWDRGPGDPDYLNVRLGLGRAPAQRLPRQASGGSDSGGDPALTAAAAEVVRRHGGADGIPITLDLTAASAVVFTGPLLPLLRAFIISMTRAHGPESVRLHALAAPAELGWLRALPHSGCVTAHVEQLVEALRTELRGDSSVAGAAGAPHHLIVLADREASAARSWRALAPLVARAPHASTSLIGLLPAEASVPQEAALVVSPDPEGGVLIKPTRKGGRHQAVALPDTMSHAAARRYAAATQRLPARTGAADRHPPSLLLDSLLAAPSSHPLRIPIGIDDDGVPVVLDLREAALQGDGPHGLIIGATGSGKSELLRTLLMAAAHQNPPAELAFLLVDFKGGAALAELAELPHTTDLLTNLTAELHAVDRLCASLRAELHRRQSLLRRAAVDNLESYRRTPEAAGEPLPRLLVVVDEYAELIEQSPEVLDVLTSLARLGRSLGIHLLLCSQRLDDGRLRGLEAHLRYRICLRTFSASESIAALGSALAAQLPSNPGHGYVSRDGMLTRVQVALTGDPAAAVKAVQSRLGGAAVARRLCPPPLPTGLTLDQLPGVSGPAVAIGLRDLPERGCQVPLTYELAEDGHLAVVGAPRSGRSTLLTTLVTALASATPARELSIHVIAAAGGPLAATAGLPHVGTVATSAELARRVIQAVAESVTERRSAPAPTGPRTLLVIDDAGALVNADDELAPALTLIAATGQSVGVTLALSCGRWAELRGGLREAIGSRFELAGNDPSDSMLPQVARRLTERPPGRVLAGDGSWAQLALPRTDGKADAAALPEALAEVVAAVARRGGPATRPIQLLPSLVPARSLPRPSTPSRMVLGVTGPYARPFEIGLDPGGHLLVLGNSGSGRSGLLRALTSALIDQGARTWLIAPRRSLGDVSGQAFRSAATPAEAGDLVRQLESSSRQTRVGSSRDVLIVDDQELLAGSGATAGCLTPLSELLPFAGELGISVIVARRLSGYARAAYEPFFAGFLELCESAVVLSGDPSEGPVIGGVRPLRLPPGRGRLVVRGEAAGEIHVAWLDTGEPRNVCTGDASGPPAHASVDFRCGM